MPHMFYINSHGSEHTSHRQYSTNAVFVVVNILLHGECFIDVKIYEFTALMTDNSDSLSFAENVSCIRTHARCIETILTGRITDTLQET